MKALALFATVGTTLLGLPVAAQSQTTLSANLTNDQETTPVNPTTSTGAPRPPRSARRRSTLEQRNDGNELYRDDLQH